MQNHEFLEKLPNFDQNSSVDSVSDRFGLDELNNNEDGFNSNSFLHEELIVSEHRYD